MDIYFFCYQNTTVLVNMHGLRDSNSRHLVLETSALPTELNPYGLFYSKRAKPVIKVKASRKNGTPLLYISKTIFSLEFQSPDLLLQFYHPHGLQNVDQCSLQLERLAQH